MVDENNNDQVGRRKELIEKLKPEELKIEKQKLEKEGAEELVKETEEDLVENKFERLENQEEVNEDKKRQEDVAEAEDLKEDGLAGEPAEDVYDPEENKELLQEDAVEEQEAGFMEGYNRDTENPKEDQKKSKEEELAEE